MKHAAGDRGKCDKLVRQILLRQHNRCERCGSFDYLQVSHIVSRRYSQTRCDLDNVQLLCAKCHMYFTAWPVEFGRWINDSIGSKAYESLMKKSQSFSKVNWADEKKRLQDILSGMIL